MLATDTIRVIDPSRYIEERNKRVVDGTKLTSRSRVSISVQKSRHSAGWLLLPIWKLLTSHPRRRSVVLWLYADLVLPEYLRDFSGTLESIKYPRILNIYLLSPPHHTSLSNVFREAVPVVARRRDTI